MNIDNNHTRFNFQISWLLIASSHKENQDIDPYLALSLMSLFSSVQSLSHVRLCNPINCSMPGFLSITNSRSLLKLMSITLVMPSNHLILCCPLFLPPPIFPSIRVFSKESVLCIRWPKYWSFSFNTSPFNEYSGLISLRMD